VRRYRQLHINEWINEAQHWAGIGSIIEVERERHTMVNSKHQHFITSVVYSLMLSALQRRSGVIGVGSCLTSSLKVNQQVDNAAINGWNFIMFFPKLNNFCLFYN